MFPFMSKKRRGDDFGDVIRPEEYLRAEERDEIEGEDMRQHGPGKENAVGQKRRWGDASTSAGGASGRRTQNGVAKRRKSHDGASPRGTSVDIDGDTLVGDAYEQSESEGEDDSPKIEGPTKVVFDKEILSLQCRISFVDFSGLHDKRVLQQLVPLIQPRKLILVAGEEDETLTLAEDFRKRLSTESGGSEEDNNVFAPVVGHTVDASVDTNAWVVKLSRSLVRNLQWQQVRGLGVVAITGRLEAASLGNDEGGEKTKKKIKTASGESHNVEDTKTQQTASDLPPVLDVVPANMAAGTRTVAQPLHVGDMRLADLRKIMQVSGLSAEFRGEGTLLVNGMVAVRKTGTGRIEVEGAGQSMASLDTRSLKPTFFEVKQRIYEGLAVVAGS